MPVFCDKCGQQNADSRRFCKACGAGMIATTLSGNLKEGVILDKRYEIIKLIKIGGMGAIYKALDNRFQQKPCAVKEMVTRTCEGEDYEYLLDRFKKEAQILHELRHPYLPVVKDYFVEGGRYYLVIDFIEGKDLSSIMKEYSPGPVPEEKVVPWAIDILSALDYLHSKEIPIVYRDLKPANIMIRKDDKKAVTCKPSKSCSPLVH